MYLNQLRNLVRAEIARSIFDHDSLSLIEIEARRAAVSPNIPADRKDDFAWFADAAANLRRRTARRTSL